MRGDQPKAARPLRLELERDRIHSDASTDRGSDWSDAWSDDSGRHATSSTRESLCRMLLGGARGVANQLSGLQSSSMLSHHHGRHHALAGVASDSDSDDGQRVGARAGRRRHHSRSALNELGRSIARARYPNLSLQFCLAGGGLRREATQKLYPSHDALF